MEMPLEKILSLQENKNTLNNYDVFMELINYKIYLAESKYLKIDSILISEKAFYFLLRYFRERLAYHISQDKIYIYGYKLIYSRQLELNQVKIILSDF